MGPLAARLREFLDASGVPYEVLEHRSDYRAEDTAHDTGTPPAEFAKTVFVCVDGENALAVLPATHHLSERRLEHSLAANHVRLASESEMAELVPDCEIGAAPPFGNLWGLPVYVSPALARDLHITFNAGSHEVAVRMRYSDFERLARPTRASMARNE